MSVEEILKEIANFGFPIVIAIYLLMVFGSKLTGSLMPLRNSPAM
jgi:hypothetical protein